MKRSLTPSGVSRLKMPFVFQIVGIFVLWTIYRLFFRFPEWIDEVLVKALVFGGPAFLYARSMKNGQEKLGFSAKNFWQGMYIGLLIGGLYGSIGVLRAYVQGVHIEPYLLFASDQFWSQFFLALMTAWWESVFFFSYVMNVVRDELRLPEAVSAVAATLVFVAFHAPLRFVLEGVGGLAFSQLFILGLFAMGQAILFLRTRSIFALTISHALWGMVLLVYGI